MKLRKVALLAMVLVVAAMVTSSSTGRPRSTTSTAGPGGPPLDAEPDRPAAPAAPPTVPGPPGPAGVVSLAGLRGIPFGVTEKELSRRGVLDREPTPCGRRLAGVPTADPVFAEDRLVLLWANGQTRTPEGIRAGTPVERVRDAYPRARRLTAPAGSYRLDGLLARKGDRAYLFLHDGQTVRKTVVGYTKYARKLFDEGFGTC
ncbi:hypothetical protein [Plantactinospora sp. GCM10030261]|uniref:hypothetical protein n=1 Tax=Plantactinospora sp. GCM10030261 TaxID=3273420 RepID=UPI00361A8179